MVCKTTTSFILHLSRPHPVAVRRLRPRSPCCVGEGSHHVRRRRSARRSLGRVRRFDRRLKKIYNLIIHHTLITFSQSLPRFINNMVAVYFVCSVQYTCNLFYVILLLIQSVLSAFYTCSKNRAIRRRIWSTDANVSSK
jgi:hypothetical protein